MGIHDAVVSLALAAAGLMQSGGGITNEQAAAMRSKSIYDFTMKDINGKVVNFKEFKGKTLLFVNVASKCGLTPQYEGLQKLYTQYQKQGLVVLGFPANEFNGQEPGSNEEIKTFCSTTYGVTFPMFAKIVVKGEGIHPLYQWLLAHTDPTKDIDWNFAKFLVSTDGTKVQRFSARTKPDAKELVAAIQGELAH